MRPEPPRREERPFEMHPDDARTSAVARNPPQGLDQAILRCRDERRQVRGHARLEQRFSRPVVAVGVRVEQVDAAEAVHLQVDEPRRGGPTSIRRREPEARDPTVDDLDVAGDQRSADNRRFDAEPHPATAAEMSSFAVSSRARALAASMPARRETIATRTLVPAASSASSARPGATPVAVATICTARARSFWFPGLTST